jgi:hypothetical protein
MEIRANAKKNQEHSGRFMKNMLTDSGYFITILHKNSTPPLPRKASAQGRATWGGGGV